MDRGRAAHRALDIGFKQYVDERASLKSLLSKPTIEHIENRQQSFVGRRCSPLDLGFKLAAGPHGFAPVQEGNGQVDLGVEIAVETGLRASRFRKNRIDTDMADTFRGEQIIGGAKKSLARLHWIFRFRLCQFDSSITRCWAAPISAHVRAGFFRISPAGVQARAYHPPLYNYNSAIKPGSKYRRV